MEKIPCIKCTPALWEYIKPFLKEWKYMFGSIGVFEKYQLLVINYNGGEMCTNVNISEQFDYNRELVTNVEEFLERAAKLKGKTYKRNNIMKIHNIEIKPGMVLIGKDADNRDTILVAFPLQNGIGFATAVNFNCACWTTDYTTRIKKLTEIRDLAPNDNIGKGNLLWDESKEVILTMDQIAKKFGYPVEQIKITK